MKFPISLRDYFAGQLVIGLGWSLAPIVRHNTTDEQRLMIADHIKLVYEIADAMIKQREM